MQRHSRCGGQRRARATCARPAAPCSHASSVCFGADAADTTMDGRRTEHFLRAVVPARRRRALLPRMVAAPLDERPKQDPSSRDPKACAICGSVGDRRDNGRTKHKGNAQATASPRCHPPRMLGNPLSYPVTVAMCVGSNQNAAQLPSTAAAIYGSCASAAGAGGGCFCQPTD
jgi:hypothetical protein